MSAHEASETNHIGETRELVVQMVHRDLIARGLIAPNIDPAVTRKIVLDILPENAIVLQHFPTLALGAALDAVMDGVYENAPTIDISAEDHPDSSQNFAANVIAEARHAHNQRHGDDIPLGTPPELTEAIVREALPEGKVITFVPLLTNRFITAAVKAGVFDSQPVLPIETLPNLDTMPAAEPVIAGDFVASSPTEGATVLLVTAGK